MPSPVAFNLFGLEVRWYGILIGIGTILAYETVRYLAKRMGILPEVTLDDFLILTVPLGVLGARVWYVLSEWDHYSQYISEIINIRQGGLATHDGIVAGILVDPVYCKRKGHHFFDLADYIAPGLVLAQGIGHWGNYMSGEAHGEPIDLPWAILMDGARVHSTFLYESILDLYIFTLLFFYVFKRGRFRGQVFALYGILYNIGRHFIRGLRAGSSMMGPFRTAQLISIALIIACLMIYVVYRKKEKL